MPEVVLTDNMTSVSNRKDAYGKPIMNATYDAVPEGMWVHLQEQKGCKSELCFRSNSA